MDTCTFKNTDWKHTKFMTVITSGGRKDEKEVEKGKGLRKVFFLQLISLKKYMKNVKILVMCLFGVVKYMCVIQYTFQNIFFNRLIRWVGLRWKVV